MLNFYNKKNGNSTAVPAKNNAAIKKVDYTKYVDPNNDISSSELKRGLWLVKHKGAIYKTFVSFLIAIDVIILFVSLWGWVGYFLGYQKHQKLERGLTASINYMGIHPAFTVQPIQILGTQFFMSRENKFDATAIALNPNDKNIASFDYYFVVDGKPTKSESSNLLPGETRPLAQLGNESSVWGGAPIIVIENLKWKRVSPHLTANPKVWQRERLNFEVKDFVYLKSLAQEGNNVDAVQFKLTNSSPFGYKQANFFVALLQNQNMVGILPLQLEKFESFETRDIDLRVLTPGLGVTEVSVYPLINIYDESIYMGN